MTRQPSRRSLYKDVSETDFQEQVIDLLGYNRWKVAHFRTAQTARGAFVTPVQADGKGFPDLFAVHPPTGDAFGAELKAEYASATPEQVEWCTWLERAGLGGFIWRPSDIDTIIERCRKARP